MLSILPLPQKKGTSTASQPTDTCVHTVMVINVSIYVTKTYKIYNFSFVSTSTLYLSLCMSIFSWTILIHMDKTKLKLLHGRFLKTSVVEALYITAIVLSLN